MITEALGKVHKVYDPELYPILKCRGLRLRVKVGTDTTGATVTEFSMIVANCYDLTT